MPLRFKAPRRPAGAVLVAGSAIGATAWYTSFLLGRHEALATHAYDLAFFQQLVWNLISGHGLVSSFERGSFLGLHFSPLLIIPAGLELLWADSRVLSVVHAVAIGSLGPAACFVLRATLGRRPWHGLVAAALGSTVPFWPVTQEAVRADFHPEGMGVALALFAAWAGLAGRPKLMWALGGMALLSKEDVPWGVAVAGALVAVRGPGTANGPSRVAGRRLAFASLAYGIAVVVVVMPAIRAATSGTTPFDAYYGWAPDLLAEGGPGAVLASAVSRLTRPEGWLMVIGVVVSGSGLAVLRPRWLTAIIPPLALNLLSAHEPQPSLRLQYGLSLLVPSIAATALGARRLLAAAERRRRTVSPRSLPGAVVCCAGAVAITVPAVLVAATAAPFPPLVQASARDRFDAAADLVPDGAAVIADDSVASPLANRTRLGLLGEPIPPDAYVVADRGSGAGPAGPTARARGLEVVAAERNLLFDDGRFRVWGPER